MPFIPDKTTSRFVPDQQTSTNPSPIKNTSPAYGGKEGLKRFAFGGGMGYGTAPGSEDVLPMAGQTVGAIGGFGGSVAGATIGQGLRQGAKAIRGTRDSEPRKLFGIGPQAPGIVNDLAGEAAGSALTEGAFRVAGKALKPIAGRLMNSTLRPALKDISGGKNLGQDASELGLFGTKKGIAKKAGQLIENNEAQLENILKQSKGEVDVLDIASNLDNLKSSYANIGDDASIKAIEDLQSTLMAKSPNGKISVQEANQLKRDFYKVLKDSQYGTLDVPAKAGARKQAARGLKEGIEKAVPDQPIGKLNKEMAVAGKTRDAIEKRIAQSNKNNVGGLTDVILGGGGLASGNPIGGASLIALRHLAGSTPAMSGTAALFSSLARNPTIGKVASFGANEVRRRFGGN